VAIRRRKLQQRDIERHLLRREQARDVGEEDRHEVRATFVNGFPQRPSRE
jgi:hypothetical protein